MGERNLVVMMRVDQMEEVWVGSMISDLKLKIGALHVWRSWSNATIHVLQQSGAPWKRVSPKCCSMDLLHVQMFAYEA
ncbi:hypothetical protein Lalb_Chr11g0071421 [Lupinus albus]|uniref:Uncharacterized protein n=1 Tax=Lupinus albus TaxID=3870 RepID=A0A6A4PSK9_LUPAL|nr:hypothetical protein Lalb_Chr11g0071421 [Lupinus albus]